MGEEFRQRFVALATRAAIVLGARSGADLTEYWLRSLFIELRKHGSRFVFGGNDRGGTIERVCEASAWYCKRLETDALNQEHKVGVPVTTAVPHTTSSVSARKRGRTQESGQLGKGGVQFSRRGEYTLAEPCFSDSANTVSAVRVSYDILSAELPKVYSLVKANGGQTSGEDLKKHFQNSPLARVTDQRDWDGWAKDFSPNNPDRGRPKGAALTGPRLEPGVLFSRNRVRQCASLFESGEESSKDRRSD